MATYDITVLTLMGTKYTIQVNRIATVGHLKEAIAALLGYPTQFIKCIHRHRPLIKDDLTLAQMGIIEDEKVHVVLHL